MPPRARTRPVRSGGLEIVSDLTDASFQEFLGRLPKVKAKDPVDGVADLTRQQLVNVSSAIDRQVGCALEAVAAAAAEQGAGDTLADTLQKAVPTLHGAAILAYELLVKSQQQPPEQLQAAALKLHDGTLLAGLEGGNTGPMQDAVMRLTCAWWERRAPGNELLVARTVPYVLFRAMEQCDRGKATHVHQCYVIRDMLDLLDFQDENIADVKRLLCYAAMHPAFLRQPEGRRFVAGLFRLDPDLTRELGQSVRNQIPAGQRATLEAYGEVLFRAWRDTVGPCAAEVEGEVVQGLMQAAILASTPTLAAALRVVLNGLHSQRHVEKRLDPALVRLYDPILPRAFGAANSEIRRNAINLLVAAFPICDPEAPAAENDTRLTQQLGLMLDCLADSCPAVREAAVTGVCSCLNRFWEIIPAATSAKMLQDMTGKLAFDSTSRAVRVAVLRGLRVLVDNQHAQPVLKKALPAVSCLLADSDPAVRGALMDLLVAVAGCRGLHFWTVVPPEELLDAVASDADPEVARKIAQILVPSYFPNAQEGPARLAALLRAHPASGEAFCRQLVSRFMPDGDGNAPRARGGRSGSLAYTASVPLEQVLVLVSDFTSHLLATATSLPAAREAEQQLQEQQQEPPNKRTKPGAASGKKKAPGGGAGGGGGAAAGAKKRGKKKAADTGAEDEEVEAQGTQPTEEDEDVLLADACTESPAAWLSILRGLAAVATGVGAAVAGEECSEQEVAAAVPEGALQELLQAAEEQAQSAEAMRLVMQVASSLEFLPAARRLREGLFERLRAGSLPGLGVPSQESASGSGQGDEAEPAEQARIQWDEQLLSDALEVLSGGPSAPKLVAMLAAALGVRQPQIVRKPVPFKRGRGSAGGRHGRRGAGLCADDDAVPGEAGVLEGHAALQQLLAGDGAGAQEAGGSEEDEIVCAGCHCTEPDETMLLCDGCDAACHIECLRPTLPEVPECEWFCWSCELQLQDVALPAAAAGRCVSLLLQQEAGRRLMCGHKCFGSVLQAMRELAIQEAEEIAAMVQSGAAGADGEADSAPAPAPPCQDGPGTPGADSLHSLLDDPWGAVSRYCRAAMHHAMFNMVPQDEEGEHGQQEGEEDGGEEDGAMRPAVTPRRSGARTTPGSSARGARGRRGRRGVEEEQGEEGQEGAVGDRQAKQQGGGAQAAVAAFEQLGSALTHAVHMCSTLAQLALDAGALPARTAVLQYCQGVLRVLHFAHHTDLVAVLPEQVASVCALCGTLARLACAEASTASPPAAAAPLEPSGAAASPQPVSCTPGWVVAKSTFELVLGLVRQLTEAVKRASGATAGLEGPGSLLGAAMTPGPAGLKRNGFRADEGLGGGAQGAEGQQGQVPEDPPLTQQLEGRFRAAAEGGDQEAGADADGEAAAQRPVLPPRASLERLAAEMVDLLCSHRPQPAQAEQEGAEPEAGVQGAAGVEGGDSVEVLLAGARAAVADMVGELLVSSRRASRVGWLAALCRHIGDELTRNSQAGGSLQAVLLPAAAENVHKPGPDQEGGENDENSRTVEGGSGAKGAAEVAGAVGVSGARPAGRSRPGRGGAGAAGGKAGEKEGQLQQPVAARLLELLQRESRAAGLLAAVVVRVSVARKIHGRTMLALADLVQRSLAAPQHPHAPRLALGASLLVHLICAAASDVAARSGGARAIDASGAAAGGSRSGALAKQAAAHASRAEAEASAKALTVLRAAVADGRALQRRDGPGVAILRAASLELPAAAASAGEAEVGVVLGGLEDVRGIVVRLVEAAQAVAVK